MEVIGVKGPPVSYVYQEDKLEALKKAPEKGAARVTLGGGRRQCTKNYHLHPKSEFSGIGVEAPISYCATNGGPVKEVTKIVEYITPGDAGNNFLIKRWEDTIGKRYDYLDYLIHLANNDQPRRKCFADQMVNQLMFTNYFIHMNQDFSLGTLRQAETNILALRNHVPAARQRAAARRALAKHNECRQGAGPNRMDNQYIGN